MKNKQTCDPEIIELDTLHSLAAARNSVLKNYEQNH